MGLLRAPPSPPSGAASRLLSTIIAVPRGGGQRRRRAAGGRAGTGTGTARTGRVTRQRVRGGGAGGGRYSGSAPPLPSPRGWGGLGPGHAGLPVRVVRRGRARGGAERRGGTTGRSRRPLRPAWCLADHGGAAGAGGTGGLTRVLLVPTPSSAELRMGREGCRLTP